MDRVIYGNKSMGYGYGTVHTEMTILSACTVYLSDGEADDENDKAVLCFELSTDISYVGAKATG